MSRFAGLLFPPRYADGVDGLISAEQDLERLAAQRDAYAAQPDITSIWQGYIDQKASAVAVQQVIVSRLKERLATNLGAEAQAAAGRDHAIPVS